MRALLLQIPVPHLRWPLLDANIPLAAGYLAAWARGRAPGWEVEILPWDRADLLGDEALLAAVLERRPDLVGLSTYLWNAEAGAALARRLAGHGVPTVLGGPEVAADNPWLPGEVPFATRVAGEGEEAFARLLRARRTPSAACPVDPSEALDLGLLPSPYLSGLLGPSPDGAVWIETQRGCPFRCAYCAYGKGGPVRRFPEGWLAAHLRWAREQGVREVYLMDPSFNVRPDWERVLAVLEREGPASGAGFHTELVAEALGPGDARRLARAGLRTCEVGLQSADPKVLARVGRPWDPERWVAGVQALQEAGIAVSVGIIAGLPGDTLEGFCRTVSFVLEAAPGVDLQAYPLSLLPGTRLRRRAGELGLRAVDRPPYTVLGTPTMSREDISGALLWFEEAAGLELDPPGPPPIGGPWHGGDDAPYWSGVRVRAASRPPGWEDRAARRAARHLTVWVEGWDPGIPAEIGRLARRLPHTALTVVLEDAPPWSPERIRALRAAAPPWRTYLDRHMEPLLGPGSRVLPRIVALVEAGHPGAGEAWIAEVRRGAEVVWALDPGPGWVDRAREGLAEGETLYLGGEPGPEDLADLARTAGPDAEGLLFASPGARETWDRLTGRAAFRAPEHRGRVG